MPKAAELKALAKQRAELMTGFHFAAGVLAINPELCVPDTIEVRHDHYDHKSGFSGVCVDFTMPRTPAEQACKAMLACWEVAVGPITFDEPYIAADAADARIGYFGSGRCGDIMIKICAFHGVPPELAVDDPIMLADSWSREAAEDDLDQLDRETAERDGEIRDYEAWREAEEGAGRMPGPWDEPVDMAAEAERTEGVR